MRKGATAMFSIPGTVSTLKKLKTDDRLIRDIHSGVIVSSYRDIQRILGQKETSSLEVPDEWLGLKWELFSTHHHELAEDWLADVQRMHPFSILQGLDKASFSNFWYTSGSPLFIVKWMQEHQIPDPEEYRHVVVNSNDFISVQYNAGKSSPKKRSAIPIKPLNGCA